MRKMYFLFVLLFFIACKKEATEQIAYSKFDTVQCVCGVSTVFKANYDGDRLISLIGQGSSMKNYYFNYNSAGQLIQRDFENTTGRQQLTEYKYNSSGQLVEKKELFAPCASTEYYKYTFAYDDGKLIEATAYLKDNTLSDYIFSARRVYTWTGGNITSMKVYDINNVPYPETLSFTYDLTKPNPIRIFKDFWLQDIYDPPATTSFLMSKNLLTKWVWPTHDCVVNYTFENIYNNGGRVRSVTPICLNTFWTFTYTP